MENPALKWMMTRGTPMLGNHHILKSGRWVMMVSTPDERFYWDVMITIMIEVKLKKKLCFIATNMVIIFLNRISGRGAVVFFLAVG